MTEAPIALPIADRSDVVVARRHARDIALHQGLSTRAIESLATALSEVAHNIVDHASAGCVIIHAATAADGRRGVVVVARDGGPGIPDIGAAMADGYSTRGGLGLGLASLTRLVDEYEVVSSPGIGTTVTMRSWVEPGG